MESSASDLAEEISQQTSNNLEQQKQEDLVQNLEELSEECSAETIFSLESQDIDSNQGPLSSGSTEFIQENFQEMGIDNNWQDEPFASSSTDFPMSSLSDLPSSQFSTQQHESSSSPNNDRQLVVYQPPGQVAKENVLAGSCGLRNLGNTCFMSAGLQCLTATPAIVRFFLSELAASSQESSILCGPPQEAGASGSSSTTALDAQKNLTMTFARLMAQMWEGKSSIVSPHFFKRSLANTHTQFKDHHQHDCQEFLALLLDTLHEQLNSAGVKEAHVAIETVEKSESLAVAGCSHSDEAAAAATANTTPSRTSNIEQAEILMMAQSQSKEKNCVEQSRSPPPCPPVPCSSPALPGLTLNIKDMLKKEAKTSNVNVLAPQHTEPRPNNQIKFDSEKFGSYRLPPYMATGSQPRGIRNMVSGRRSDPLVETPNNLSECSGKDGSGKRLKQTNLLGQQTGSTATSSLRESEHEACANSYKRLKLVSDIKNKEEVARSEVEMTSLHTESEVDLENCATQQLEADAHWLAHLSANKSIVADSFQGQFRSTVVCSVCHHISVTFEAFMYLSVPLPHAMELQIPVTYVPANPSDTLVRYLVSLNKYSSVRNLRDETLKLADRDASTDVIMCEGFDHHMSRVLELESQLKMLKDNDRNIYAIEMLPPPPPVVHKTIEGDSMEVGDAMDLTPGTEDGLLPKCNICLEEMELSAEPLRHGTECECVLCRACLEACKNHQVASGQDLKCPVCSVAVNPDLDFVVIEPGSSICKPVTRVLQVPVVFRIDSEGEQFNNKRSIRLFGEPRVLRLPSKVTGSYLYHALSRYAPTSDFSILLVCGHGLACSRCMYNSHCTGCVIEPSSTSIHLQTHDTLAVRMLQSDGDAEPPQHVLDHESMRLRRKSDPLSLYDCLQAFTKSEMLDEQNPWFCPKCMKNQCATKTLSVWRYPEIVIVYLKRFVFHNNESMKLDDKVTFPLTGLTLQTRRGGGKTTDHIYNLYSCVCHFGRLSSGHYTAYSKHPRSTEWFYYDDEDVTRQRPKEEDFSTAYVLFYQREHLAELII